MGLMSRINANDLKRLVVPHRRRPTIRPRWFGPEADVLEYLEEEFEKADEAVQKRRRLGKFKASHAAFVTFEKMSSAVCWRASHFRINLRYSQSVR